MSRFTELKYTVSFLTPAFLGNVDQSAQWRTPPFKALLREWWRIALASKCEYDHEKLLDAEKKLFGHAADTAGDSSSQSKFRIRLSSWNDGTQLDTHTQLKSYKIQSGRFELSAGVYLGYGPIQIQSSRTAISADSSHTPISLTVVLDKCTPEEIGSIQRAMQLAHWFGSLGSRSRNGWGSVSLIPDVPSPVPGPIDLSGVTRNWKECLRLCWPHAIGCDDRGTLVWRTTLRHDWKETIKDLAKVRIMVNSLFHESLGTTVLKGRHILSYPVTKSEIKAWGGKERVPNQLRFKVIRAGNQYQGLILHVPCSIPDALLTEIGLSKEAVQKQEVEVWDQVHHNLDNPASLLTRTF